MSRTIRQGVAYGQRFRGQLFVSTCVQPRCNRARAVERAMLAQGMNPRSSDYEYQVFYADRIMGKCTAPDGRQLRTRESNSAERAQNHRRKRHQERRDIQRELVTME